MVRGILAVLRKDLRIEWRTKESLASFVVLGVLLVVIFSVALDPAPADAPRLAPSVLWATVVFTGLLGIQRGFVLERENDCLGGLLASPLDPAALYLGKLAANVVLLAVMQAIVVPLVAVLLHVDVGGPLPALVLVLLLGNLGFAALATLFAAMTVRARAREVMLPVLLLPLLVPVLIGGVKATEAALRGGLAGAAGALGVLAAFDAIFLVAGILLFEQVIRGLMRSLDALLAWTTLVAILVAQWMIFVVVPTEAEMGIVQRIFYFHVPVAWATFLCFFVVAGASAVYLWKGSETADRLALASAEVGVLFCTLVLITGPIWARPIWGVWWTWDPRLTMTVILWAIYAGYLMLRAFGGDDASTARYAAVVGIVGVLDIPVIRVSVRLLQGIHPAVLTTREGESGLTDPTMRATLYVSAIAMLLLAAWLVRLRVRTARLEAETATLRRAVEAREGAAA